MTARRLLLAAVALALAVLVASPLAPNATLGLASSAGRVFTGALGVVVVGLGLAVLNAVEGGPTRRRDRRTDPVHVDRVVGESVDEVLESLGHDGDRQSSEWKLAGFRSELRDLVMAILVDRGYDRETAERLLESGEWTADPRAAAFLSFGRTPVPLGIRIRDWIFGERDRRYAEHAVEAVVSLAEEGRR